MTIFKKTTTLTGYLKVYFDCCTTIAIIKSARFQSLKPTCMSLVKIEVDWIRVVDL